MIATLHITSGDSAGVSLVKSGLPGEVLFAWHDILYDGPRGPGWPVSDPFSVEGKTMRPATIGVITC